MTNPIRTKFTNFVTAAVFGLAVMGPAGLAPAMAGNATETISVPFGDITTVLKKAKDAYPSPTWNDNASSVKIALPLFDSSRGTLTRVQMDWTGEYHLSDTTEVTDASPRTYLNSTGTRYTQVYDGTFHTDTFGTVATWIIEMNGVSKNHYRNLYELRDPALHRADVPNKLVVNTFRDPYSTFAWVNGLRVANWNSVGSQKQCKNLSGARLSDPGTYPDPVQGTGLTLCKRVEFPKPGLTCGQRGYPSWQTDCPNIVLNQQLFSLKTGEVKNPPAGTPGHGLHGPLNFSAFVCNSNAADNCTMKVQMVSYLQSSIWCSNPNESGGQDSCEQKAEAHFAGEVLVTYDYTTPEPDAPINNLVTADQGLITADPCHGIPGCRTHQAASFAGVFTQINGVDEQVVARGEPESLFVPPYLEETFNVVLTSENNDPETQCWSFYDDDTISITRNDEEIISLAASETSKRGNFQAVTKRFSGGNGFHSINAERGSQNIKGEMISHYSQENTTENFTFRGQVIADTCEFWLDDK